MCRTVVGEDELARHILGWLEACLANLVARGVAKVTERKAMTSRANAVLAPIVSEWFEWPLTNANEYGADLLADEDYKAASGTRGKAKLSVTTAARTAFVLELPFRSVGFHGRSAKSPSPYGCPLVERSEF